MSESPPQPTDPHPQQGPDTGRVIAWLVAGACVLGIAVVSLMGRADSSVVTATDADQVFSVVAGESESNPAPAVRSQTDDVAPSGPATADVPIGPVPENFGAAGTLTNLDGWLQTEATSLEDFDGQVKIVQFWTFSCRNCTATIANLQQLYETYQPEGLEIIGVHAPEFSFEEDPDAVLEAAQNLGVVWPIAIDNHKTNFRSWQSSRRFWPRTYVIDTNGDIRFDHIGEGAYAELEETVAYLIGNGGA